MPKIIVNISEEDYREVMNDYEEYKKHKDLAINSVSYAIATGTPLTERNSYCKSCINRYEPIDGFRCRNCTLKPSMYEYNKELDNETDN